MKTKRLPMTRDEALSFKTFSLANATTITAALAERGCTTCQPYEDVFTFNRWKALGWHVKKGEHGMKIPVITEVSKEEEDTGETTTRKLLHTAIVFCRCQCEPND